MEIDQLELGRQRGGWFLRLTIDKAGGGVTLDDCQRVSQQFGAELDSLDLIPTTYTLEVSSPGLDRPLRSDRDFVRFSGRLVAISTFEPVDGQKHFVGRLKSFQDGIVTIADERGAERRVPRDKISKARLELEF